MNEEELIEKAIELKKQNKFEEALEKLMVLFEKEPHSETIKKAFIEVLFEQACYLNDEWTADYEKAIQKFKQVIELDPSNYQAWYNLGISHFKLNDSDEALKAFNRTLEIKPDYVYCYYNIGLLYEVALGDLETALNYYEKALKFNQNFTYALQAARDIRQKLEMIRIQSPLEIIKDDESQKICKNCGNSNRDNAKYCDKCGEIL